MPHSMLYVLVAFFPGASSAPWCLCPMLASQVTCEVKNSTELDPAIAVLCVLRGPQTRAW